MAETSNPFGNLLFLASNEWTKTCSLPPVMMVSILALTVEVSKGLMMTLSFSFTVSSNDLISRGRIVTSVQTWFTLAQKAHCIVLVLTVAHTTDKFGNFTFCHDIQNAFLNV